MADSTEAIEHPMRTRRHVGLLLGLAVVLRVAYLSEYDRLPFLYGPVGDSVVYLMQARHVAAGQFGAVPLLAASPLYGYFLALFGAGGQWLLLPVLVQLCLGCATTLLIYRHASNLSGDPRAGLAAAGLFMGYGAPLFFESKLLSDTLGLWLTVVGYGLYLSPACAAGRLRTAIGAGATLGLAVLARASLVFAAPLLVGFALLPWSAGPLLTRNALRRATGVALGLGLVLGGNGLWTLYHAGTFVPVIMVSRTVEKSSGAAWDGHIDAMSASEGVATPNDVLEQARQSLRAPAEQRSGVQIDLAGWLRNAPRKALSTFGNGERTFQYGYLGERSEVPVLRFMPVGFGLIALWGLVGAVVLVRRRGWRALLPYLPLLLGCLATTTLYHPSSRYRLAMIIPMLWLGGPGLLQLLDHRKTTPGRAAIGISTAASIAIVVLTLQSRLTRVGEWELQLAMSAAVAGDDRALEHHLQRAAEHGPNTPSFRTRWKAVDDQLQRRRHRAP